MSSEQLGAAQNVLKGNLGGAWDITNGYQDAYTDLGIARRFGGSSAAYSLRDIGAMNGEVVKVRRDGDDVEEDFSASQVQSGTLENWVNGKLENTLPADVATAAAAFSLRKVKSDYSGFALRVQLVADGSEFDVSFDANDKVSTSSLVTRISGNHNVSTIGELLNTVDPEGDSLTVVTWYDQSGNGNNAVQATSANQPKIAENGALLADGLEFDGTNDRLVSSSGLSVTTSTDISFSIVGESDDITSIQTIISQKSGTGQGRSWTDIISSNFRSIIGGSAKTFGAVGSNGTQFLFTYVLDESANTADAFRNAAQSGSQQTVSNAEAADGEIVIGANNGESGQFLNGHLKELIIYTSDQSDNRFRIESNINNYYGLYNDANEFASDETAFRFLGQRSGGTSTSSDLTKFTLDVQTASGYAGAKLSADVVSSDVIYVSFNASLDEGSATASPKVGLRDIDSALNGTVYSNEGVITEGFNSFALTSTNSNASGIVWSEGDDNVIFTISDIKVSRIERNGFVPTWYDQSTSGNNAVQATAGNQPSIVKNGGICKSNGSPSVLFTGDTRDDELDLTDLTLTDAAIFTVVNIDSSADQQILLGGGSVGTSTGTMIPMMDNSSSNTQVYKNSTVGGAEQGSSQFKNGSAVTLADRDDAFDNLAVDSQILFTMIDVDVAEAKVLDGISRPPTDALGFHLQGHMNELIIYNSDQSSDRGDIELEIANHYSITLS